MSIKPAKSPCAAGAACEAARGVPKAKANRIRARTGGAWRSWRRGCMIGFSSSHAELQDIEIAESSQRMLERLCSSSVVDVSSEVGAKPVVLWSNAHAGQLL